MVETFNNYIMNAKSKHLINMLDEITTLMNKRLVTRKEHAAKWDGVLCPKVQKKLDKEKEEATKCSVLPASDTKFQVTCYCGTLKLILKKRVHLWKIEFKGYTMLSCCGCSVLFA